MTDFQRIEHVAIAVIDAEAAVSHFSTLGFTRVSSEDVAGGIRSHIMTSNQVTIEILASNDGESSLARFIERRGEGLHHVCLGVDSLDDAITTLGEAGCSLVDSTPVEDADGTRVFVHPTTNMGVLMGVLERHDHAPNGIIEIGSADFADRTYSAAVSKRGTLIATSGLNALDDNGVIQCEGDIVGQARIIYTKLAVILEAAGSTPSDVIKTTDYLVSREGYRGTAEVRRAFFGSHRPAATGVVVSDLLGTGVLIEIDALAIRP